MNSTASASEAYFDLASLARLEGRAKDSSQKAMKEAAQQFEALFMQMMLKSMRDATIKSDLFSSDQLDTYNEMYDQQIALHLSKRGSFGLADMMVRQLGGVQGEEKTDANATLKEGQSLPQGEQLLPSVYPLSSFSVSSQLHLAQHEMKSSMDLKLFDGPKSFVETLHPYAVDAADVLGIHPKFIVAQAALESGWGGSMIRKANGEPSFNLFGIKAGNGWQGEKVIKETIEYEQGVAVKKQDSFRAYADLQAGMKDYVDFLSRSPRYQEVLLSGDNPQAFVLAMQESGYATDPHYANKLLNVLENDWIRSVTRESGG